MTYDERVTVILGELIKMMEGYAEPRHLNTQKKKEDEVRNIVRMLNQKFPNDTTEDHIRGTMDRAMLKLKEAHKSRTWPTAADISAAVSKSMNTSKSSLPKAMGWKPDSLEVNAKRIKAGEPVGEMYIQGKLAERMVRDGLVTEEELAPYLVYLDAHKRLTQSYE
jgi:hypothetical protein